jgi:tRNA(Ile)-lysidine synthase
MSVDAAPLTEDEFAGLMAPFSIKNSFVVAVSGGVDSLALCFLAHRFATKHHLSMTALTVDHGLRSNSGEEALWVHQMLTAKGINHEIVTWTHESLPVTKIQESARNARYALLGNWCSEQGVDTLLTAHHQGDLVETFFMRLGHRSGLKGLASIRSFRKMPFGELLRPLLSIPKTRLFATLQHADWQWCEDPSNANDRFERVRMRTALESFYAETDFTPNAIAASIQKLQAVDDFLNESVDAFFKTQQINRFELKAFKAQHPLLQRRILTHIITQMSTATYVSPDAVIHQASEQLMLSRFKGVTMAGLHFRRSLGGMVDVLHEKRAG